MGKTRRTGDLVTDNNLYVNPTDDSFHVGTGITMYGGSVGIISCTELYLGGTAMAAGTITRVSSRVVATDGQTAFTVSTYDSNLVDVFLNGVKLDSTEYNTTNSTTITLVTGASTGDVFEATSYSNFSGINVDNATNSTNISVADESSDTTCFPLFANDSSGTQRAKTDSSALTYNAGTGTLSATSFSGDGSNLTGITATTATNVTVADESSDTTCFPLFVTTATGDLPPKSGGNLTFDSASGILGATTFQGNLDVAGLLKEGVNITAGKLSANTNIDLADGMVHLFTTTETATSTPNIRVDSSTSLDSSMSTGESITVVLISAAAAAGYSAQLTIDGGATTEEWLGGSAPSEGGSGGYDVYTYNIIKTGSATFIVLANVVNFA